jgi:hypothetical protein
MCFESGGGRRVHDNRHVFGGCRLMRNVKDRINSEMPQTAIRNYMFMLTVSGIDYLAGRRGCRNAKAGLRKTTLMS